ncbi:YwiC-like family protein [Polyangium jinanense]|uniref:YwiC-like family protein n=1 Tax=Polyangium jinanense TaxID=2829994 RepID=A0A9X3X5Z4_9BACT|nr:YwiC-like family protein [Polyangium jinanense]MDC3961105.1 YwiC-like family protein [Polyangium jinanense]MDC3982818.1 YwiC-like family protein [Polyangium jinanense]
MTSAPLVSPAPARSLAPREHGAYGQLGLPLVAGLALGRPGIAAFGLTIAWIAAFLAHEPVLVLLGQRGKKARTQDGPRAARRLVWLGAAMVLSGCVFLIFTPAEARLALVPPVLLGLVVMAFVWRKEEKTAAGEIIAAAALSGAGFPVALASGVALFPAAVAWIVWTTAFLMSTLAVRAVIARAKHEGKATLVAAYVATISLGAASVILALRGALPMAAPIAVAPFVVLSLAVTVLPVHTRHLRRIGWGLIGASVATLGILVATLR